MLHKTIGEVAKVISKENLGSGTPLVASVLQEALDKVRGLGTCWPNSQTKGKSHGSFAAPS